MGSNASPVLKIINHTNYVFRCIDYAMRQIRYRQDAEVPMSMMHPSEHVIWHEGLLMAPQHMQMQAHYHDAQLQQRLAALSPHAWGVVALTFDDASLGQGVMSVQKAQLVMPSGMPIAWDMTTGDAPLNRPLSHAAAFVSKTPAAADGSRKLDIYLGVAHKGEGMANVAIDDAPQTHQRYRSHSRLIAEQTFGQTTPVEVLLGSPHVQLLFAHELTSGIEAIHIAELQLTADGFWLRQPAFTPPALRLHHHTHWLERLHQLARRLRRHADGLAPINQLSKTAQIAPRWSDVQSLLQLRALESMIPLVEHVVEDTAISAREAYLLLKQALALSTPLLAGGAAAIVPYHHMAQHTWLQAMISRLEAVAPARRVRVTALPLEPMGRARWQARLPAKPLPPKTQLILEVRVGDTVQDTSLRWLRQAKIAAPSGLEQLIRAALSGIALEVVALLPDGMHAKAEHIYLRLDVSAQAWADAVMQKAVAIAPPKGHDDSDSAKLLLVETLDVDLPSP